MRQERHSGPELCGGCWWLAPTWSVNFINREAGSEVNKSWACTQQESSNSEEQKRIVTSILDSKPVNDQLGCISKKIRERYSIIGKAEFKEWGWPLCFDSLASELFWNPLPLQKDTAEDVDRREQGQRAWGTGPLIRAWFRDWESTAFLLPQWTVGWM